MKNSLPAPPIGRVVVLDTAALIAGTSSLYALGGLVDVKTGDSVVVPSPDEQVTFCTIPDVIHEVRDKRARARLALLDGAIVVRAPSSDAVSSVITFAKATGDFSVLSMTDIRVMALCWMLEVEKNSGKFLRPPPERVLVNEIRCGALIPFAEVERLEREAQEAQNAVRHKQGGDSDWKVVKANVSETAKVPTEETLPEDIDHVPESAAKTEKKRRRRRRRKKPTALEESTGLSGSTMDEDAQDGEIDASITSVNASELNTDAEAAKDSQMDIAEEEEEDDGLGWINMENLAEHLAREGGEEEQTEEDHNRIGCITTDFAMQNTMLQMGLKLLSVDGRRTIRKIKHFALRCHTCGSITTELERIFCNSCGNASMHRVAFKVDKRGIARSYLNPKKQPILRGTKYPIPMPRGGRHNRDLILCEDQIDPVKQRRLQKQRERLNTDVLDPSNFYNAGARFNPNNRPLVVGYGRRNPNEVRQTPHCKR